ncbi:MAG: NAD(+) diphosphatase [Rhodospirillaceae bacterium]
MPDNLYAGGQLDRVATRRKDESWLAAQWQAPESRLLPIWRGLTLIDDHDSQGPRLVALPVAWCPAAWNLAAWSQTMSSGLEIALLGTYDNKAWFVIDLSELKNPETHPSLVGCGRFVELRSVGVLLPANEASIAAYARGLIWWHHRTKYCGRCGQPCRSTEAGHVRLCSNPECHTPHFPRTDPAVIMLVHDGDRCLLGRQPRFAPGVYSTLAGFVEPGESLEEAVAREVFEETGVRVTDICYNSSQPWPFPSSLMIGFHARATSYAITPQQEEMEDARWFERSSVMVAAAGGGNLRLPRTDSISRRLIEEWLNW